MTAFLERESASDLDLISAARDGDDEAVAELYVRHHDAAARYARRLADPTTAEDLVAEAFAKVLESIRAGGGPSQAFRPYLLRTVHNAYVNHVRRDSRHSWVEDADELDLPVPDSVDLRRESAVLADAFASLPERWQAVLWHTAVEGEDQETVGRMLGLKANAVAALAFRSRDGLRRAYLEAHLGEIRDEACRPYREQLASYARGRVRGRRRERLEDHLTRCPDCTAGYLELSAIGTDLAAVLAPAVLGVSAAAYAGTTAGAGAGVGVGGADALLRGRGLRSSLAAATAAAAVVAVAAGGFAWVVDRGEPDALVNANPPGSAVGGATDPTSSPASSPTASPDPTRPSEPVVTSIGSLPSASTTTAPVVAPTQSPSDPPEPTSRPTKSSPTPTDSASPTRSPSVSPSISPSVTPTATPTDTPTETPTDPPTVTPTVDPMTHEDLAIGSGSHVYYGPHHHVQMSVTALLDPTIITIDVHGLQSFTVHTESSYLPVSCAQTGVDGEVTELTCQVAPGEGPFAIDVVVSGELDAVARVSATDNVDPNSANDELVFQS